MLASIGVLGACGGDYSSLDEELEDEVSAPARALVLDREEQRGLDRLHALVARADALQDMAGVPDAHRRALAEATARVRESSAQVERLRRQGDQRSAQLATIGVAAGLILADDTTVVGVVDDPLLVVCGAAALVTLLTTTAAASKGQFDDAFGRLRADAAGLKAAVVAATAATAAPATEDVCRQPRAAPTLPRLPDRRASPRRSDSRATADVAPVPGQRDAPDDGRRGSCAQAMPQLRQCAALPPAYVFKSEHAALRKMKLVTRNASLSLRKREDNTSGPCIKQGWHINVRAGGEREGSVTSCYCCEDTAAGPRKLERWRIVW